MRKYIFEDLEVLEGADLAVAFPSISAAASSAGKETWNGETNHPF
jgi:hypothetical protein